MKKNYKNIILLFTALYLKQNIPNYFFNFDKENITINNNLVITKNIFSYNSAILNNGITVFEIILLNGKIQLNTNLLAQQDQTIVIGSNISNTNLFIPGLEEKIDINNNYIAIDENNNNLFILKSNDFLNKKSLLDSSQITNSVSANSIVENELSTVSILNTNINNENIDILIGNKNNSIVIIGNNIYLEGPINTNQINSDIDMQKKSLQANKIQNTNLITVNKESFVLSDIEIIGNIIGYNYFFIGDGLGRTDIPNINFSAKKIVFDAAVLGNQDNTTLYIMNIPILKNNNSYNYLCFDENNNISICENLVVEDASTLNTNNLLVDNFYIKEIQNNNEIFFSIGNSNNNTYLNVKKIVFPKMTYIYLPTINADCYFDKIAVGNNSSNFFSSVFIKKTFSSNLIITIQGISIDSYSNLLGTVFFSALKPISNFTNYLIYNPQTFSTYGNVCLLPKNNINLLKHSDNLSDLDAKFIYKNNESISTDIQSNIIFGYATILDLYKKLDIKKSTLNKKQDAIKKIEKKNSELKKKIEKKNNDIFKTIQIILDYIKKITDNKYKNSIMKKLENIFYN